MREGTLTTLNVYQPNNIASKYLRQNLIEQKGEIDKSTLTLEDFNNPLSIIDKSSGQEISKDM